MGMLVPYRWTWLLLCLFGCQNPKPLPIPVVGVANTAALFDTEELGGGQHDLPAGTVLEIVSENDDKLLVKTKEGKQGWVRRCWICNSNEFERRKALLELPQKVICIGWIDGGASMYGGSLSIENGGLVMLPGDSFWMDNTMKGKPFKFSGNEVLGDPDVLLLTPQNGDEMIRLKVWGKERTSP